MNNLEKTLYIIGVLAAIIVLALCFYTTWID